MRGVLLTLNLFKSSFENLRDVQPLFLVISFYLGVYESSELLVANEGELYIDQRGPKALAFMQQTYKFAPPIFEPVHCCEESIG